MTINRISRSSLRMACAIGALCASASAFAQDAAPAADGDGLNEIVVTAERRSENLMKVPVSVGVVAGDQLRAIQSGGDDILALSGRVPGLYAETTTGRIFPRFYIRGLGNIDFYLGASQPVSIIQDDVVLEHVVLKSNPVFDTGQVEVLRGPQGSLFGRNTTAGIIKFDSIKPTLDRWTGRASASYGSYNTVTADAGVGGPIIPGALAIRLSGLVQHRDNWVDNAYTGASADGTVSPKKDAMGGYDEKDVRLQILLAPEGSRFSMLLSAHARDYSGTSTMFHRSALKKGSNNVAAEPRDVVSYDEAQNNPQAYKTYGASNKITADFGGVTLTSISAYETTSGYSRGDTDGGFSQLGYVPTNTAPCLDCGESQGNLRKLDQLSEEIRLASNGDTRFKWQIGAMYFDSRDITEFYQRRYFLSAPFSATNTNTNNPNNWVRLHDINTSWGVFGQFSYELVQGLTLTAGARWTNDTKKTSLLKVVNQPLGTSGASVRLSDEQPSWDVSLLYQVDPNVSVYGRVARGFRGPTIQGRSAVFGAPFTTANSETILSAEAGIKTNLFDNRLRFNLSGFGYRVKNIQLNGNDSFGNGVLFNADKAVAYGLEADLEARPVRNLSITAGLSLLHSEIQDKRVYAQACSLNGVLVCSADIAFTRGTGTGTTYFASVDGNPLPNAPKYTANVAARYDVPLGNGGSLFASTDWMFQGFTNFVLYKTSEFYSDGTLEGGVRVGYTAQGGKYEIAAFARNITNAKNLKGVIENYMAAVFNDPRVFGVSLSGKF